MKIETAVHVKMTDSRGQEHEFRRKLVTQTQDNPIFWAASVGAEVEAAGGTVVDGVRAHYGELRLPADDGAEAAQSEPAGR